MCMAMAAIGRGAIVIATDTMRSTYHLDGRPPERDPNTDKLWRAPWGFLTSTGSWDLSERVAAELVTHETPWRVQQVIRREREQLQREQPHLWAEGFEKHCPDRTAFFLVAKDSEGPVLQVYHGTGELAARYREGRTVWAFPPEIGPERRAAIQGRWEARVNRDEPITLDEMVRATAGAFDETWPHAPSMSDRVAIATDNDLFGTVGLVADAEWLANASGIEYGERAIPAHQRFGPRPLTRSAAGRVAHSADLGTVTAGTVGANIIVASTSFTAPEIATESIRFSYGAQIIGDGGPSYGDISIENSQGEWLVDPILTAPEIRLSGSAGQTAVRLYGSVGGSAVLEGDPVIGDSGDDLAFFGGTPASKQTVTGSTGANAALQNLLTALENYGLITDSST